MRDIINLIESAQKAEPCVEEESIEEAAPTPEDIKMVPTTLGGYVKNHAGSLVERNRMAFKILDTSKNARDTAVFGVFKASKRADDFGGGGFDIQFDIVLATEKDGKMLPRSAGGQEHFFSDYGKGFPFVYNERKAQEVAAHAEHLRKAWGNGVPPQANLSKAIESLK